MFRVYYKYSACIKICTNELKLLCDPWFSDNAYDGTWTQFPYIKDHVNLVGEFDSVYISHIHPDHYCKDSLVSLFNAYGNKPILIADWGENRNYLEKKLIADGFEKLISVGNSFEFGNTQIKIIPNDSGSISDIDSALIVSSKASKKSVLNINDCIYNETLKEKVIAYKKDMGLEYSLFCLGYTGAGPYPQTYYSPILQAEVLQEKATAKKNDFFARYKNSITKIPSIKRLPFAGKYILKGDLSLLNKYRGVADAVEVKRIDPDAVILGDGGNEYFDLTTMQASAERLKPYDYPETIPDANDYYWRNVLSFQPNLSLLRRLCRQSINRAHPKSECTEKCWWSLYTYESHRDLLQLWESEEPQNKIDAVITFNCKKDSNPFSLEGKPKIHSHLFLESKALFAVLTGITHWNNYEVGSVFQVRRVPDIYNKDMHSYLNFLSVV